MVTRTIYDSFAKVTAACVAAREAERVATTRPLISEEEFEAEWAIETAALPAWIENPLNDHPEAAEMEASSARFKVAGCGRRSGKTERGIRWLLKEACRFSRCGPVSVGHPTAAVAAAPTHAQARAIFRDKIDAMLPQRYRFSRFFESGLIVHLWNRVDLSIAGLDRAARLEGPPLDLLLLDELSECRPETWRKHLYPALNTKNRPGRARLIGVPRGSRHFRELFENGVAGKPGWGAWTWPSSRVLSPEMLDDLRATMDSATFRQEFEASWDTLTGRAYYDFTRAANAPIPLGRFYDPKQPLIFCLDFNVAPGTGSVLQEVEHAELSKLTGSTGPVSCILGEVWIPRDSNTSRVCRKLLEDWGRHEGEVLLAGDATGGAKGSSRVDGSDWALAKAELRPVFGDRLKLRIPTKNPPVRARINATNSRIRSADGARHFLVDPQRALHVVEDFERVAVLEGTAGELDKDSDLTLTHLSDGVGYWINERWPLVGRTFTVHRI